MIKNALPKTDLVTKDFYYNLPEEQIAQTPVNPRDHSRLLVLKKDGGIEHKHFYDIIDYLNEGDTLVINDSRVIPARIYGEKVRALVDAKGLSAQVLTIALPDEYVEHGNVEILKKEVGIDAASVVEKVMAVYGKA